MANKHGLTANGDVAIDDATTSFDDLALAKKKKKSKKKEADKDKDNEAGAEAEAEAPAAEGELDLAALKKKKKKPKAAKTEDTEDFDAKLAKAGGAEKEGESEPAEDVAPEDAGDMETGTGVWSHDCKSCDEAHRSLLITDKRRAYSITTNQLQPPLVTLLQAP